jgi:prepilin-type N-terminal cleavage/methylation domain-containing protein
VFAKLRARPSGREGFTLIEVLVAMVILAVGLLALESMGIGAARMVARADRESEYTAMAMAELETALSRFRATGAVAPSTRTEGVATITRVPTVLPAVNTGGGITITSVVVEVTVAPAANQDHLNFRPVTVVGRASRP